MVGGAVMQESDGSDINTKILNSVAEVFQKAQGSYAGHRKHIAVLKKIQSKAVEQGYEDAFNFWFDKLVTKILPLKKNETIGDRIVKLVAAFIASLDRELILAKGQDYELSNDEEGVFSRFVDQFIRHVLRGAESPDKNVRFRVLQLLAVIMDNIGEIDESLFNLLILSLNKRIYDREPTVRIQAVFCLTKFQDEEQTKNLTELPDDEENYEATRTLVASIQNDPSAEVRRAAMLNLINDNNTRPYILERARDVNIVNRRLVYSRILKSMGKNSFADIEPHIFDQLIEWGLEDREPSVKNACKRLIAHDWLNILDGDLIELLEKLDVARSSICAKAIEALFQSRPDILSKIKFPENIWRDFTVEIAFLFRAFYSYCLDNNITEMLEENFPEASKLSEHLNHYILLRYRHEGVPNNLHVGFDSNTLEFIIEQLLITAERYDFSDEVGRRSMLTVVRNMLALTALSEPLIKIGIRVMKSLSINEKDFVTMAIEIINDIRDDDIEKQELEEKIKSKKGNSHKNGVSSDGEDNDKTNNDATNDDEEDDNIASFHSAVENLVQGNGNVSESDIINNLPPEKEASSETIVLCLTRSSYMLELVNTPLTENILIASLMDTLITPAVRNTAPNIRELGVKNLGLCCLLDVKLAIDNMYILGMCVSKGNASLKYIALQVIVDIFSVHGNAVVDGEGKVDSISLHKIFYKVLKNNGLPECQVIAAEGLCKLFLADVFTDDDLFETLVLSYFSPINCSNEALVQAFAFCIPVYCFSHSTHQQRMSRTAADILLRLCVLWDDLQNSAPGVNREAMLKPNVIFQQLIFWTDPRNLVNQTASTKKDIVQLTFLIDVLKIFTQIEKKEIKKMILTNVNAIFLSPEQDYSTLKKILEYSDDITENDTLDSVSKNALDRLRNNLNVVLEEINERSELQTKDENNTTNDQYSSILGDSFNKLSNGDIDHSIGTINEDSTDAAEAPNNSTTVNNLQGQSNLRKRTRSETEQDDTLDNSEDTLKQNTSAVTKDISFVLPEEKEDAMSVDEEDNDSNSFTDI